MTARTEPLMTWCASCKLTPVAVREPVCPRCRRAGRERELQHQGGKR